MPIQWLQRFYDMLEKEDVQQIIARNTRFIRCMSHDQGLSSADHALNNFVEYELPSVHILRLCREVCLGL